ASVLGQGEAARGGAEIVPGRRPGGDRQAAVSQDDHRGARAGDEGRVASACSWLRPELRRLEPDLAGGAFLSVLRRPGREQRADGDHRAAARDEGGGAAEAGGVEVGTRQPDRLVLVAG